MFDLDKFTAWGEDCERVASEINQKDAKDIIVKRDLYAPPSALAIGLMLEKVQAGRLDARFYLYLLSNRLRIILGQSLSRNRNMSLSLYYRHWFVL